MANGHLGKWTHRKSQKIRLNAEQTSIKTEMLFPDHDYGRVCGCVRKFPGKILALACNVSLIGQSVLLNKGFKLSTLKDYQGKK
jgi:hypothetical protein